MTVYYLAEGLKSLRRVEAKAAPEQFNSMVLLYRGMRDTTIVDTVRRPACVISY